MGDDRHRHRRHRRYYSISHRFLQPEAYTLRASFAGDARNLASDSDTVTAVVQQAEKPYFTIFSSSPTIPAGQPLTISGVLYAPGSTAPRPGVPLALFGHTVGQPNALIASAVTAADGSYSFAVNLARNTLLQAQTTLTPPRVTAQLFEGAASVVSILAGSSKASIGQAVTFVGAVNPDEAGQVIYLQLQGPDGHFHSVRSGLVNASSTYQFHWLFGSTGVKTVRVRVPGGEGNFGGSSPPVTISVSLPEVSSLPPAS